MSIYYTPRTSMRTLDYNENPSLAEMLIAHDRRMTANIENIPARVIKPMLDRYGITILEKVGLFGMEDSERSEVFRHAYSLNKSARRKIVEFAVFTSNGSSDSRSYWISNLQSRAYDISGMKDLILQIFEEYPEYIVFLSSDAAQNIFREMKVGGNSYANFVMKSKFTQAAVRRITKTINSHKRDHNSRDDIMNRLSSKNLDSGWYLNEKATVTQETLSDHIAWLSQVRESVEDDNLQPLLLLLKLN